MIHFTQIRSVVLTCTGFTHCLALFWRLSRQNYLYVCVHSRLILSIHNCRTWDSQPYTKTIPAGNILLSSSILFAGSTAAKSLKVLRFLGCQAIHRNTFYSHQKRYLYPAIETKWKEQQLDVVQQIKDKGEPLVVGGDGRADSPGHCAKFGSYTMIDLNLKKILAVELVQVSERNSISQSQVKRE